MSISLLAKSTITHIDAEDRNRIDAFLRHVMIRCNGVYTLIGSKPMTCFKLLPILDEYEKQEIYNSQSQQFKKYIPLEKFKPNREDCKKLWYDWKKVEEKYLSGQFIIVEEEDWEDGIFINIPSVKFVLNKYYDDFIKVTGQSFDPEKAVYLIGKSSETFWKKIKKNHYLLGLLFGFGEKNSQYFQWERESKFHFSLRRSSKKFSDIIAKDVQELRIEDLDIPAFATYQPIDEQEELYKLERDRCKEIYKDQDFVELTVSFLKGIQPFQKENASSEKTKKRILESGWIRIK